MDNEQNNGIPEFAPIRSPGICCKCGKHSASSMIGNYEDGFKCLNCV